MFAKLDALIHGAEVHRAYFYRLATALGAVLVGAHFITSGALATDLALVGAVLGVGGTGLASANTSTKKPDQTGAATFGGVITILFGVFLVVAILWLIGHPVSLR